MEIVIAVQFVKPLLTELIRQFLSWLPAYRKNVDRTAPLASESPS